MFTPVTIKAECCTDGRKHEELFRMIGDNEFSKCFWTSPVLDNYDVLLDKGHSNANCFAKIAARPRRPLITPSSHYPEPHLNAHLESVSEINSKI